MTSPKDSKICAACGREFSWRKKWQRDWEKVRYCSNACRRCGVSTVDKQLETVILTLLARRDTSKTICPSEAAKVVAGNKEDGWKPLMEPARRAARRLVAAGKVLITQRGKTVEASTARGPIRIRLR